ncbi:galactolipase DONGLE, chloroplastic-like [Gossypium arboreum]|uniref:galactolipase DONGLE, chloroplastic-like n=1 Tax=Gossypium arboreum TaxID=29729 RepID=UPI000818FB1D|nr:galactolipase DONGLE, chloroplastic-like [Gossypium arboreum]
MASKALMKPTLNFKHGTLKNNEAQVQLHSFGQVCFPGKNGFSSSRKSAVVSVVTTKTASPATVVAVPVKTGSTVLLSQKWREIQGLNNWESLVEPLHPLLRNEIIRYGEFVAACYKAFDLDSNSKRYLNCKYGKKNMLKEVGMDDSGYEVTKYIYATPDVNIPIQNDAAPGRWIGYVAVSSDEVTKQLGRRDMLVTFRGTVTNHEWVANFMSSLTPARLDPLHDRPDVKVESGFLSLYTSEEAETKFGLESCRQQLLSEVSRLINKYKGEELSITLAGHSMGSALALLLAYDISELGLNKADDHRKIPVTVFSFGGPRVGNLSFKQRCEQLGVKVLRIVNVNDPITKLPGVLFNENFRGFIGGSRYEFPWFACSCYVHVGVELVLDFFNVQNPSCVHDLETYINLLKWPQRLGIQKEGFDWMNKARDLLTSAQSLNINLMLWKDVAINMVNMVQSQRT